jgi:hypothetical protein
MIGLNLRLRPTLRVFAKLFGRLAPILTQQAGRNARKAESARPAYSAGFFLFAFLRGSGFVSSAASTVCLKSNGIFNGSRDCCFFFI